MILNHTDKNLVKITVASSDVQRHVQVLCYYGKVGLVGLVRSKEVLKENGLSRKAKVGEVLDSHDRIE